VFYLCSSRPKAKADTSPLGSNFSSLSGTDGYFLISKDSLFLIIAAYFSGERCPASHQASNA